MNTFTTISVSSARITPGISFETQRPENIRMLLDFYQKAKNYVLIHGYKGEVEWCERRESFEFTTADVFFFEYVYVVLNAGMKEQVARKMYDKFCSELNIEVIGHPGKRKAIGAALNNYKSWFETIKSAGDDTVRIERMGELPWIGDITKYHLARNIGIDCVKPDRHLKRLAEQFRFETPLAMCVEIQKITGEKLGVIDVVLWRYCNLNGSCVKRA